jgi:chromosome segregation ATPase
MAAWSFMMQVTALLMAQIVPAVAQATSPISPIRKVVTLIEEMKKQVEKDAEDDTAAYDKYMCWCETNRKEKTAAVKNAEEQIEDLTAFVQEAAAKESELKTEIATLEDDVADDQSALTTASAVREKESSEFQAEEADMKETRSLLDQAIKVLSKVQLLQRQGKVTASEITAVKTTLLQLHKVVSQRPGSFQGVLQKDLFDVLGALQEVSGKRGPSSSFGETFLPRHVGTALDQRDAQSYFR